MDRRELEIWEIAKKRISFRYHFTVYLAMIHVFWTIWYLTSPSMERDAVKIPWPIFPILGWGVGILFHYLSAYRRLGDRAISEEFEKLKNLSKL